MILITGGTGFIGKAVVDLLARKKMKARLLSRDGKPYANAEVVQGDLLDRGSIKKALKGVDTVIHLAGAVSYKLPWDELYRSNVLATRNLVEESRRAGVKRFIFASSVSVYGPTGQKPNSESSPTNPATPYGRSKVEAEKIVAGSGIHYVSLRIGPVFGAGSAQWIKAIKLFDKGFPVPKTKNKIHLVHVSDVAEAFCLSLARGRGAYNISGPEPLPVMEFCRKIIHALGRKHRTIHYSLASLVLTAGGAGKEFRAFTQNRQYNISKARKELGYAPHANLDVEIKRMVKWYKDIKKKQI